MGTENLKVLDLSGILDFSGIKWCVSYDTIDYLSMQGIKVELGKQEHY